MPTQADQGRVTSLTLPSGEKLTFTYTTLTNGATFTAQRLQSVNNNLGYQLSFEYQSSSADTTGLILIKVTAINNAVDYCAPTSNGCTGFTQTWPSLSFSTSGSAQIVTDSMSRATRYTLTSNRITGIRWPASSTDDITISYNGAGRVSAVANAVGTWTYGYEDSGNLRTTTVTNPVSQPVIFVSNLSIGRVIAFQNGTSNVTQYTYDSLGRLATVVRPQGGYTSYGKDARGNVTQITEFPNTGSSGPTAFTIFSAVYPSTCTNPVTCNLPESTTDARGFRTDYTYDSTHGGLLTVTSPAPSGSAPVGSGTRPQVRYAYQQLYARYNQGSGVTQAPTPVYRLTSISTCATLSSCSTSPNRGDETLTSISYTATGDANNLLPTLIAVGAGDGSLTAETRSAYDAFSNLTSVDGPLSGTGDTTYFWYNAGRERVGTVAPDPDSSGALKRRAIRYNYGSDGRISSVERGTVNSESYADWAAFTPLEQVAFTYDALGRRTRESLVVSGTTYAVTQYSFDAANRLDCTAQRMNMNSTVLATLPGACTLSTEGSAGPDRITRVSYDGADRVSQVTEGYGTAQQHIALTRTYTPDGMLASLTDSNSRTTIYEYDGIDRIIRMRFPDPVSGTSATDYEQYTYDATSNVTERRLRDGSVISLTYDNLGRASSLDAPSGTSDVAYAYDNFGRLTSMSYPGPTHTLSFAYDQLSRLTSATAPQGTVSYQYDLAGNRTRVT